MAFKEYQHREINPKNFPKRTSSLPANDMIIVPYNYRPNSRLRHATNSSFMDSMKGVELVRSQSFSAYSCPDDLKNVKTKQKKQKQIQSQLTKAPKILFTICPQTVVQIMSPKETANLMLMMMMMEERVFKTLLLKRADSNATKI